MPKFDPKYFDEEFYKGKTKGAIRDKDSPFYRFFASRTDTCIKHIMEISHRGSKSDFSILDVGGGVGWEAHHYLEYGYDSHVCDVSSWAIENTVMPVERARKCDVRKLVSEYGENKFDLVIANRVLAYLPNNREAQRAINQLAAVSKKSILFAIICSDHKGAQVQKWTTGSGRLNYQPKSKYEEMFSKNKLWLNERLTDIMLGSDWDCVWWMCKE